MKPQDSKTITLLLEAARGGEEQASQALVGLLYGELRVLAHSMFASERTRGTLQPTALVHEAWMKMSGHIERVADRRHFFALASRAMRQVLVDHARGQARQKRGDGRLRITLDENLGAGDCAGIDLVELSDSLTRLAQLNERHASVVELRILGGLTIAETAEALGVSHDTVEGAWFTAKAWLRTELGGTR